MASLNSVKHGSFLGLLCSIMLILYCGIFHFSSFSHQEGQNLAPSEDSMVATYLFLMDDSPKKHCLGPFHLLEECIPKRSEATRNR